MKGDLFWTWLCMMCCAGFGHLFISEGHPLMAAWFFILVGMYLEELFQEAQK